MSDENVIPDASIILNPLQYPIYVRPNGPGWRSWTTEKRSISIDIGDKLNSGGRFSLLVYENVKNYQVEMYGGEKVSVIFDECDFKEYSFITNALICMTTKWQ